MKTQVFPPAQACAPASVPHLVPGDLGGEGAGMLLVSAGTEIKAVAFEVTLLLQ